MPERCNTLRNRRVEGGYRIGLHPDPTPHNPTGRRRWLCPAGLLREACPVTRMAAAAKGAGAVGGRSRKRRTIALDDHDLGIITRMENDARCGVGDMARALGIHRNTVTAKLNRLIRERVIKPSVYVDPRTLGYRAPAIIGIKVLPGEIERVAARVASLPNIHHVHVCVGRYDIVLAGSLFRNEDELLAFVTNEVTRTPGVTAVETMITVGLSKVNFAVVDEAPPDRLVDTGGREAIGSTLDEGDYAIIRELQRDARQSVFGLAASLGMNRNTVALKLKRLLDDGIVRAVSVTDPGLLGYRVMAMLGLSVLPGQIEAVLGRLRGMRHLQTAVLCIGRYSMVVWCLCHDLEDLYETLTVGLADVPGLREVETMLILRTKKATLDYLQPQPAAALI